MHSYKAVCARSVKCAFIHQCSRLLSADPPLSRSEITSFMRTSPLPPPFHVNHHRRTMSRMPLFIRLNLHSTGTPLETYQGPDTYHLLLEPTDLTLRMKLAKSRVTDRHGESISPGSGAGNSTISVILTPSLWLSQGGGVLISVEVPRANFTLHSSAIATVARLATRTHP